MFSKGELFIFLCVGVIAVASLPKQLSKCPPSDNACLASAIESAVHALSDKGSRELGVAALDPILVSSMVIPAGPSAVQIEQTYSNVKCRGLKTSKVNSASYNEKDLTLEFVVSAPNGFIMDGDYDMAGKILLIAASGKGPCKITLVNPLLTNKLKFKEVEKEGKKYLEIVDYKLELKPERINFQFDNLFDGNKELADVLLKTINDSWDVVFEDVGHSYEESFAEIFKSIGNQLFSHVPKDDLF